MNEHTEGSVCMICRRIEAAGIHICAEFICESCEREIVSTDVSDAKYPFFIHQMKQIFHQNNV